MHGQADPFGGDEATRYLSLGLDDGELVTADPRDDVTRARLAAQQGSDMLKEPVAFLVAEAVVHELEAIGVQQEQHQSARVPNRAGRLLTQSLVEMARVVQAGELVGQGELLRALERPSGRDREDGLVRERLREPE